MHQVQQDPDRRLRSTGWHKRCHFQEIPTLHLHHSWPNFLRHESLQVLQNQWQVSPEFCEKLLSTGGSVFKVDVFSGLCSPSSWTSKSSWMLLWKRHNSLFCTLSWCTLVMQTLVTTWCSWIRSAMARYSTPTSKSAKPPFLASS